MKVYYLSGFYASCDKEKRQSPTKFSNSVYSIILTKNDLYFSAPEAVKKIFSVGHLGKKEYNTLVKTHYMNKVRRHQYDEHTTETRSLYIS